MIPVYWLTERKPLSCQSSVCQSNGRWNCQALVTCEWLSSVVFRFHSLGFYCDVLLKRRLVICEIDISAISHSPYFFSTQKIFLWCKENEMKSKDFVSFNNKIDWLIEDNKNNYYNNKTRGVKRNDFKGKQYLLSARLQNQFWTTLYCFIAFIFL